LMRSLIPIPGIRDDNFVSGDWGGKQGRFAVFLS